MQSCRLIETLMFTIERNLIFLQILKRRLYIGCNVVNKMNAAVNWTIWILPSKNSVAMGDANKNTVSAIMKQTDILINSTE